MSASLVYTSYSHLIESNLLDKIIFWSCLQTKWFSLGLFLISCVQGIIPAAICFGIFFLRTTIDSVIVRRILAWITILWAYSNKLWFWVVTLLLLEIFREGLRYGLPYFFQKISNQIPTNPPVETFIHRLFRLARTARNHYAQLNLQQLARAVEAYQRGDVQEPFTAEEKQTLRRFFQDFEQTSFIIDQNQYTITIFFPTLMVRFSSNGIQYTGDGQTKLIRIDSTHDNCPICHNQFNEFIIELKCKHRFCHSCIFEWFNHQYNCPMCRRVVN
jgi:hypothetical protein